MYFRYYLSGRSRLRSPISPLRSSSPCRAAMAVSAGILDPLPGVIWRIWRENGPGTAGPPRPDPELRPDAAGLPRQAQAGLRRRREAHRPPLSPSFFRRSGSRGRSPGLCSPKSRQTSAWPLTPSWRSSPPMTPPQPSRRYRRSNQGSPTSPAEPGRWPASLLRRLLTIPTTALKSG